MPDVVTGYTAGASQYDKDLEILTALTNLNNCHAGATAPSNPVLGMWWYYTPASGAKQVKFYGPSGFVTIVPDVDNATGGLAQLAGAVYTAAVSGVAATADAHFPIAAQINARRDIVSVRIGGPAGTTDGFFLFAIPESAKYTVEAGRIICDTATSGSDGSNYWRVDVVRLRSTSPTAMQSALKTTNGNEIAAFIPWDLSIDQTNEPADLNAADVILVTFTKVGAPTDLSGAEISLQLEVLERLW